MKTFWTVLALILLAVACQQQPGSVPASAAEPITAADTLRLRTEADTLLTLAKSDTLRTDSLLLRAADHFRRLQDQKAWVATLTELYRFHKDRERYERVCQVLENAVRDIWWEPDGQAGKLYAILGFCLRQTGRNYAASIYYEKARVLSDRHGNVTAKNPAGPIYKTLANIKTRLGENEEAEKLFRAALDLLRTDTSSDNTVANGFTQADIFSDLGIACQNAGDPAQALEQYETGLVVLEALPALSPKDQIKAANTKGMLLANKASALALLGRLPEAERAVQTALSTMHSDKPRYRFSALGIQADIQEMTGDTASARATRETALDLARNPESNVETREVAKLLNTLGWAAISRNDYPAAAKHAQAALCLLYPNLPADDLRQNPDPAIFDPDPENAVAEALDLKSEALWQLFQTTADRGQLRLADSTTALAILMMENLRNAAVYESSKLGSAQQSRSLFGRMFRILYAEQAAGDAEAAARAFVFSEKSKAVLLHQKVAADAELKSAGVADSLIEQERDLKERWAHLRNQLFQHQVAKGNTTDSTAQYLKKRLYQIEEQQRQLHKHITDCYRLSPDGRDAQPATAADVQRRLLRKGETWLSYFTDRDSSTVYIVSVDKNNVRLTRQLYRDEAVPALLQLINDAKTAENRSLDSTLFAEFVQQSRHLYETLLLPALPDGNIPARLALSPDGALALLPFDVLLYQTVGPNTAVDYAALPYLATVSQTRLSASASLELFYAERPQAKHAVAYVGFAPDYSGSVLGQVKEGKTVVQQFAAIFDGKAYIGAAARLDSFRQQAGGHAILHFHGHAEASDSFPDYSWMAFTAKTPLSAPVSDRAGEAQRPTTLGRRPGRMPLAELEHCLFAHQIYHAHLGADLVLLSACRTGLGKIALGEGTMSLSRAFQAAGCPATVMSLWEVRDDATAELMRLFLENIHLGQDKDEALTNAKRTYLQTAPDAFPYFWAGFVLTGKADPVRLPGTGWARWLVLALLLGGGIGVALRKVWGWRAGRLEG